MSHARNTAIFGGLTLVSRLTGLLRMMALAAVLGLTRTNDAYQLAYQIPFVIYEFIMGGLLSAIFIPVLVREQERSGRASAEAWRVANLLVGGLGAILAVVSLVAVIFSPQLVQVMTFMARDSQNLNRELATHFLRFFAPQMFFYGLSAVFMAILNSHDRFAVTAAAPICNNVVAICTLLAYSAGLIRETGLAVGTTAGVVANALFQVPFLVKLGMPMRPRMDLRDPVFASVAKLGAPIIVLSAVNLLGTTVRTNLLYTVPGALATYNFSFLLIMMPYGIIAVSVATVLYPAMARAAADTDKDRFLETMSLGLRWTTMLMLPVSVAMALLAEPITRVLFERGQFTFADTIFTGAFLQLYALSILPYSLVVFCSRAFYSMKDTVTPTWINAGGVCMNIVLNFVLMHWLGAPGIALASTLTYVATTCVSVVMLRRVLGRVDGRRLAVSAGRMVAACFVMALVVQAAGVWSRPSVSVLERGSRLPFRVPRSAAQGNGMVIGNRAEFEKLWQLLGRDGVTSAPRVSLDKETIVCLFGPASASTSTLALRHHRIGAGKVLLRADVYERPLPPAPTSARDLPTSPAYLLAYVRGKVTAVVPEFVRTGQPPPSSHLAMLRAPGLARLVLLICLGACVYCGAALVLRVGELKELARDFRRRRGGPPPPSDGDAGETGQPLP